MALVHYLIFLLHYPLNVWCLSQHAVGKRWGNSLNRSVFSVSNFLWYDTWYARCIIKINVCPFNHRTYHYIRRTVHLLCWIYHGCGRLGFVQGVLRLSPSVCWDTLQPPCDSAYDKQFYIMDGWKFSVVGLTHAGGDVFFLWNMMIESRKMGMMLILRLLPKWELKYRYR